MADRNDEEILRAILEKGSDKAKQQAAAAIAQQPPTPADPPVVKAQKKKRKGLAKVAGALGKQKFYYGPGGTIVDKDGAPAPPLIADMLRSKDQMVERVRENIVQPSTRSQPNLNAVNSELNRIVSSSGALARTHDQLVKQIPQAFGLVDLAIRRIIVNHHAIVQSLIKQNEELQDKVIESLTGVKAPTRAAGAVSRPKRGAAARAVGSSRLAKTTKLRDTKRRQEVLDRRERIMKVREERNKTAIKRMTIGGALVGAAVGAATSMFTKSPTGTTPTTGAGGGTTPGPTGNQPSPDAQRSNVPGMVELVSPISKKKYVVAQQYAANFKGFVDELENSGYKIKSIGGYANRNIAGTGQKSFHSLGVAIDINPSTNPHTFPPKGLVTDMPSNVAAMAAKYGLGWGGNWRSSKDAMHFSMAAGEGGSVRIDRSGVAPLPGAPAAPAPAAGGGAVGAPPGVPQAALAPSPGTPNARTGAPARVAEGTAGERPTGAAGFRQIMEAARKAGDPFPEVVAGQWAIESGWGKHMTGRNNPFGQTGVEGRDPGRRIPTPRDPGGGSKFFRDFDSIDEAVALRVKKWAPWYAGKAKTAEEALMMLQNYGRTPRYAQGYNNDWMSYVTSISGVIRSQGIDPKQSKESGTATAAAPTAPLAGAVASAPPGVPERAMAPSPGTPNAPTVGAPTATGGGGGNVREAQNGIRRLPLSDKLRNVLQQAARAAGVDVVVTSGGQPAYPKGPRTGSTRHDLGNAADLDLYVGGKILTDANPQHIELKKKFVAAAASAGASGIGAGYMGPTKIHVGFGTKATWGGAAWMRGITPGSGSSGTQYAGAPSGTTAAGGAVSQGSSMSQASAMHAMAETMMQRGPQLVVMNNTRTMMHTRTVHRGASLQNTQRPNTGEFNPFDVIGAVAAGFVLGKATRLF